MHSVQTEYPGNQLNLPICAVYRKVCCPNMQCNAINFPFFSSKLTKEANIISMEKHVFFMSSSFLIIWWGFGEVIIFAIIIY